MATLETMYMVQTVNQPYKYNGKEIDRLQNLDMYDYGARHYDAALGRWITGDPLAEKYYNISQYVYMANNPVMYVDPDGRKISPYFDENGVFLGVDENGYLGDIYISNKKTFLSNSKDGIADSRAIQNSESTFP